jgi:hypothetical protein
VPAPVASSTKPFRFPGAVELPALGGCKPGAPLTGLAKVTGGNGRDLSEEERVTRERMSDRPDRDRRFGRRVPWVSISHA